MGNNGSIPSSAVGEAKAKTQLDEKDVQRLRRRFQRLVGDKTEASLQQLSGMPEFGGNLYIARLFALMDSDKDGSITFLEFCLGISMYKAFEKTSSGKFQLLLRIHDVDKDGKLSKKELADLMSVSAGQSFSEQQVQELAEALMETYDRDGDGALDEREFGQLALASGAMLRM